MKALERAEDDDEERLDALLKRCRTRIARERPSLGTFLRLPVRIGKAVTQEEVAEAVGISRQWYAMLESNRPMRVSAAVLARIADALMMESTERATLYRLALPELRSTDLTERSTGMLEAFVSYRPFIRRLWAATTEAEALTVLRERALTQLAPDGMQTCTRLGDGRWDRATTGDPELAKRYDTLIGQPSGSPVVDDLCCYTLMAQPGDLMTRAERDARFPDLAAMERPVLRTIGLSDMSFAMATVRSQHGFVARLLAVHRTPYPFSELERAHLSTLADLASIALSGAI